jgi:hypothetical protein
MFNRRFLVVYTNKSITFQRHVATTYMDDERLEKVHPFQFRLPSFKQQVSITLQKDANHFHLKFHVLTNHSSLTSNLLITIGV